MVMLDNDGIRSFDFKIVFLARTHTHTHPRLHHDIIYVENLFQWSHRAETECFLMMGWRGGWCRWVLFRGWDSTAMPLNTSCNNKGPLSTSALAFRAPAASGRGFCWPASKPRNSPMTLAFRLSFPAQASCFLFVFLKPHKIPPSFLTWLWFKRCRCHEATRRPPPFVL